MPPVVDIPADSNVEMTWRVFGGSEAEIYAAILKNRCLDDGLKMKPEVLAMQFRLHLHRGIGYLVGDPRIRHISDLTDLIALIKTS